MSAFVRLERIGIESEPDRVCLEISLDQPKRVFIFEGEQVRRSLAFPTPERAKACLRLMALKFIGESWCVVSNTIGLQCFTQSKEVIGIFHEPGAYGSSVIVERRPAEPAEERGHTFAFIKLDWQGGQVRHHFTAHEWSEVCNFVALRTDRAAFFLMGSAMMRRYVLNQPCFRRNLIDNLDDRTQRQLFLLDPNGSTLSNFMDRGEGNLFGVARSASILMVPTASIGLLGEPVMVTGNTPIGNPRPRLPEDEPEPEELESVPDIGPKKKPAAMDYWKK